MEDDIAIESIKEGGEALIKAILNIFNTFVLNGTTPAQWHNAIIVIMHKKGNITYYRLLLMNIITRILIVVQISWT